MCRDVAYNPSIHRIPVLSSFKMATSEAASVWDGQPSFQLQYKGQVRRQGLPDVGPWLAAQRSKSNPCDARSPFHARREVQGCRPDSKNYNAIVLLH